MEDASVEITLVLLPPDFRGRPCRSYFAFPAGGGGAASESIGVSYRIRTSAGLGAFSPVLHLATDKTDTDRVDSCLRAEREGAWVCLRWVGRRKKECVSYAVVVGNNKVRQDQSCIAWARLSRCRALSSAPRVACVCL